MENWPFYSSFQRLREGVQGLSPQTTPSTVDVLVYRVPADESAPHPVLLPTTSRTIRVLPDLFPSHIPDVWPFWNIELDSIYRDWEITQLKEQDLGLDGLYMTIYCFDDESAMPQNHNVPHILKPSGAMYGDVFVAKLGYGQCGKHGWAQYQDVCPYSLQRFFENKTKKEVVS